jgi:glycosyltransferase involved in cell wall biosynthesis
MNILHLRASNFYGGPERQLHFHARRAQGSEFSIRVGSFAEGGRSPEFLDVISRDGLQTALFPVRDAYDRSAIREVKTYLRGEDIDILCTHDYRTHLIGWLASRDTSTRWIAFSRGWTKENIKVRLYHTIDRVILRLADHVVAVSAATKRRLTRLLITGDSVSVVHNAVEPTEFMNIPKVDLKARYSFPVDAIICICAGRFSREKGQVHLVDAAAVALEEEPRLRFVLFGDGPDLERARAAVSSRRLQDRIVCPGFEKSLPGCIKGANIVVNPSLSEGVPNVVLEAMALEVPVLATPVGGVPEVLVDGHTGYLVPPGDTRALAQALLHISRNPDQARQIAQRALQHVNDNLTFDKQYDKLTTIYRKVVL